MVGATDVIVGNAPVRLAGVASGLQSTALQAGGTIGAAALSSFAFHHAKPSLRRPRLDDQQRRLRVQPGGDDLGDVGKKQVSAGPFVDRSGENRPPGDLSLARPLGLLTLLRVKRRAMQGEPRIPPQVRTLARPRHRPEPELTVSELALDARDPRRAVGPQRRDRLVPACVEEPPHPRRELGLRLLHVLPRCHSRSMRPIGFPQTGNRSSPWPGTSVGQGAGEAEPGEHAVVEPRDAADPAAGQGEDLQPRRAGDARVGVPDVGAEGGLAVGAGRDHPVGAALPEGHHTQEPRRQLTALVLQRDRRHAQQDVVGEQGDEGVDVAGVVSAGEPGDELAFGGRIGRRGRVAVFRRRELALERGAGPLERAGHRLLAGLQHASDLAGPEPEDVAQDEHGALAGRQQLQGGHEGQRDGLGGLVAGLGAGRGVGQPLQQHVGVGLEPGHLAQPGGLRHVEPGQRRAHGRAAASCPQRVQAAAGRDLVEPGPDRGTPLEAADPPPRREHRLLQRVLGILGRAEDPVAVHLQLVPVRPGELAERIGVPRSRPGHQVGGHHAVLASLFLRFPLLHRYRPRPGRELGGPPPPAPPVPPLPAGRGRALTPFSGAGPAGTLPSAPAWRSLATGSSPMTDRFTDELWRGSADIYDAILAHPFFAGLTDGSLEQDAFVYYVVQDAIYLRGYAQALAAVASHAPDTGGTEMFARHAAEIVTVERTLHDSLLADLGIDPASADEAEPAPTTLAYVSYLLATARGGSYAEGAGAVLPCYWIYWEVGKELLRRGSPNPRYQQWIGTYGGEEYGDTVREVIAVTDQLGPGLTAAERALVHQHFRTTSRYEWMFWDMGYRQEGWPV